MARADDPFAFTIAEVRPEPNVTFTRGPEPVPIIAGTFKFAGTLDVEFDQWDWFRNMRCPGCGTAFADLPAGHSWSSAKDGCWIEAGPIDEYGQPIGKDGHG